MTDDDGMSRSAARRGLLAAAIMVAMTAGGLRAHAQARPAASQGRNVRLAVDTGLGPKNRGTFKPHLAGTPFQGQLAKPIERYSGQELVDLLQRSSWFGFERARLCSQRYLECRHGRRSARMQIQAIGDANTLPITSSAEAFPNGVVIGVLRNVGLYRDSVTQVPGDEQPPSDHFFVVLPNGTATAQLKIATVTYTVRDGIVTPGAYVRIDTSRSGITPCVEAPGHAGRPRHSRRRYPQADFATCSMPTPADTILVAARRDDRTGGPDGGTRGHRRSFRLTGVDATPWFACNEGCCTTQSPPD